MTMRIGATLSLIAAICITVTAQQGPTLTSLNMPRYTRLERQARVQGIVKVAFTLPPHSGEPTNIQLVSGRSLSEGAASTLLTESAVENVKTWRFENGDAVEHRYETTIEFRISDGKDMVFFQSFRSVTVVLGDAENPVID